MLNEKNLVLNEQNNWIGVSFEKKNWIGVNNNKLSKYNQNW